MNIEAIESALGVVGLTLKNMAAGAVSSFVALRFFEGLPARDKWSTFLGGWALAAWGGSPVTSWLELGPKVEIGIVLLLGLFGMAVAAEAIKLIRSTDWRAALGGVLARFGGKSGGS